MSINPFTHTHSYFGGLVAHRPMAQHREQFSVLLEYNLNQCCPVGGKEAAQEFLDENIVNTARH